MDGENQGGDYTNEIAFRKAIQQCKNEKATNNVEKKARVVKNGRIRPVNGKLRHIAKHGEWLISACVRGRKNFYDIVDGNFPDVGVIGDIYVIVPVGKTIA